MQASTRLSSAVFQLTPTRTRCDFIIIAKDKKEKIASGLLNPFLAHLKTAQDQIAKGGYSILLEPETGNDAAWFTKATLERFVRFVSTPEILERVYTLDSEILQIDDAIAMQNKSNTGKSIVDHLGKPLGGCEGNKSEPSANEEKAIVLYKPEEPLLEAYGTCLQEANSKVQLLKVLETRKVMLQKEQGMAFARAAAAGFDVDHMKSLVSFAECFGALRLMEACSRFMDLWKDKHDNGEWLDIEASEPLSAQSDSSAMNAPGIILSAAHNRHDDSDHDLASEDNGKLGSTYNADNPAPYDQHEYLHGQFPHILFPSWPMHALPGAQPVFQAYPVQEMPYYQTYTVGRSLLQPPHHPMDLSKLSHRSGQKMQLELWGLNRTRSLDDMKAEVSHGRKPREKAGGSSKRELDMLVIQNVNYITSEEKKSGIESNSDSDSNLVTDDENFEAGNHGAVHWNSKRSSKSSGNQLNFSNDEASNLRKDFDDGHWQAFQSCLLGGSYEDAHGDNEDMFVMEKGVIVKRRTDIVSVDTLALGARNSGEMQNTRVNDIHRISGNTSCRPMGSGDDALFSREDNDFRGFNDQTDIQFAETKGRKILSRTENKDFIIDIQQNHTMFRSSSDPLALYSFEGAANSMDRESLHGMADETFIVPFRSISIDQVEQADRTTIHLDSEISLSHKKFDIEGDGNMVYYEPDDLSLMPERETEKRSVGYDPALDHEMHLCSQGPVEKEGKDVTEVKGGLRKSDNDRRSKFISESMYKQIIGGSPTKGIPLKMNQSGDARVRAERLRAYKADLQKMKKEKEEAEVKRLEALKVMRQKRIAARGSSTSGKPSVLSPHTKQFPVKVSPASNRGSKFSDSEPGPSSPLQRSKVRTSLGSSELLKASRTSKLSEGSHMAGNLLTRSLPSLSDTRRQSNGLTPDSKASTKRQSNGVTPDSKASLSQIRRSSEPKTITSPPVTSKNTRSAETVSKQKLSEGSQGNKISTIINLDRSKAAALPELETKTLKSHTNKCKNRSAVKDQKTNETKQSMFCENAKLNAINCNAAHQIDADDNPIVEKTVMMLEYEKPSLPTLCSSEEKVVWNQMYDDHDKREKSDVMSELAPTHATPSVMDDVDRDLTSCQLKEQLASNEVRTSYPEKDLPKFANITTPEKPYKNSSTHVSPVEDLCTGQMECGKAPQLSSEQMPRGVTVKKHVLNLKNLRMGESLVPSEKTPAKKLSKGLRRLLQFGKKNHTSLSVDKSFDSDCTSVDGTEHCDNGRNTASTCEVRTLKNLISQDERSTAGNASQKISRHFPLLSSFWSKNK